MRGFRGWRKEGREEGRKRRKEARKPPKGGGSDVLSGPGRKGGKREDLFKPVPLEPWNFGVSRPHPPFPRVASKRLPYEGKEARALPSTGTKRYKSGTKRYNPSNCLGTKR